MSNVNNYSFANKLQSFKEKMLDPQIRRVEEASIIMDDPNYKWASEKAKTDGKARYESYKAWQMFYQSHYDEGLNLCTQHEQLVDKLSKWYDSWWNNISNEGKQETELMSSQADMLVEMFTEIYKELMPLKLEGMKAPAPLNMK